MPRVMYFDCFSGAAGDMILAALIDAGLPVAALREALGSLGVEHQLEVSQVVRTGIAARHVTVRPGSSHDTTHHHHHHHHHHHSLADIERRIRQSGLSRTGRDRAVAMYRRLAEVEAAVHDMPIEQVHLHEVGAVDSIIDVAGVVFGMEWFGIDDVVASPLNVGGGTVEIAHGTFPVPAPATLRLLTGVPIYSSGPRVELVTPTGALLMSGFARSFGPMPAMRVERIGYGAGTREHERLPNVLRVLVGHRLDTGPSPGGTEQVVKIECEIDDMNPQLFGPVSDRLFEAGALDVFLTAIQMKKGRPGTLLTVLAPAEIRTLLAELLFRETTTLGVRYETLWRETLDRRWEPVPVDGGEVRIKVARRAGRTVGAAPEFEDCLRVANATGRPVRAVQAEALRAWFERERDRDASPIE